ncbi:MAG: ribonuclease III [Helicobacteraceae bacterium]|jgi:ribonuclease-3|nr:ribonuclease III [Helicobacteraceae bacterium]
MKNPLESLEKKIGYRFKSRDLLQTALTHRSVKGRENNERLEFLGDAVLDLIVGEYLFRRFSNYGEGDLTKLRAALVSEEAFARIAFFLGLDEAIFLSASEARSLGRAKPSILANAYEALIGAIYLDRGIEAAKKCAIAALEASFGEIDSAKLLNDYKTKLQELTQAKFGAIPEYRVVGEAGPDHKKEFEISLSVDGVDLALGKGASKKAAEQKAAQAALIALEKDLEKSDE